MAWTAKEVVDFSDRYRGTFFERGGSWSHKFPNPPLIDKFGQPMSETAERELRAVFYARLAESADAVKTYLREMNPAVRRETEAKGERGKVAADRRLRAELIERVRAKSRAVERPCLWFSLSPSECGDAHADVPDGATLLVVEQLSDKDKVIEASEWVRLPALPPPPETGKYSKLRAKAKRKRRKNSPGSGGESSALFADSGN